MTYISSSAECPQCGDNHKGKPFCTYANGVHCFSCGFTQSYDRTFSVPEQRTFSIPEIPDSCFNPSKFSIINLLWLNKYYVTNEDIIKHQISEAPDGALVFCTVEKGKVVHYQKRWNTTPRRILSYGPKTPAISSIGSSTIALVEDYVSYVRLSKYIDVACLWGTKASYEFLNSLLTYEKILVWLDNDKDKETNSGQIAANKICNSLNSILSFKLRRRGFGNTHIPKIELKVTDCDPKAYSPSELEQILGASHAIRQ
jgi:hypothetical protein